MNSYLCVLTGILIANTDRELEGSNVLNRDIECEQGGAIAKQNTPPGKEMQLMYQKCTFSTALGCSVAQARWCCARDGLRGH